MTNVEVSWDNDDQTVIRIDYQPGWRWEDLYQATKLTDEKLYGLDYSIPFINVYHPGARLPEGSPLPHMQRARTSLPSHVTTLVTQDKVTEQTVSMFLKMIGYVRGVNYWVLPTLEEARATVAPYTHQSFDDVP